MAYDLNSLFCLSLSAKSGHAVQERESARLPEAHMEEFLRGEQKRGREDAGILYLQTCHRVEFYGFGLQLGEFLERWSLLCGAGVHEAQCLHGAAALAHLMRVASSLESEVLGETQITGQLRDAAEQARQWGLLRGPLMRCVDHALHAAKRVRSETALGEGAVSVAHVAVDGLFDVYDSLEDKAVLVVGAGPMAQQSLERLFKWKVGRVTWANRHPERLVWGGTAEHEHRIERIGLERLHALVWTHQVTIAATGSSETLIKRVLLEVERPARVVPGSRVLLDLGLPRNVDERVHGFADFYVRNVDEFNNRIEANSEARRSHSEAAEIILAEEMAAFLKTWETRQRAPLLAELYGVLASVKSIENDHLSAKLPVEVQAEMEYMTGNILAKLLHRLVTQLEELEEPLASEVLETVLQAWRHPEEWLAKRSPQQQQSPLQKLSADLRAKAKAPKALN